MAQYDVTGGLHGRAVGTSTSSDATSKERRSAIRDMKLLPSSPDLDSGRRPMLRSDEFGKSFILDHEKSHLTSQDPSLKVPHLFGA